MASLKVIKIYPSNKIALCVISTTNKAGFVFESEAGFLHINQPVVLGQLIDLEDATVHLVPVTTKDADGVVTGTLNYFKLSL